MPAQHAAPATQQLAAKAVAENVDAPITATALRYMDFMESLQLIDIDGRFDRTSNYQSGGFHGGGIIESLHETSKPLAASGSATPGIWPCPITIAGAMEQPMQPCSDCESAQHGSKPTQHAIMGAATAPITIQAKRAMATKREKDKCIQRMGLSLLDQRPQRRDSGHCAA